MASECGKALNHCVQLVGYNTTASTPYWIVRNSVRRHLTTFRMPIFPLICVCVVVRCVLSGPRRGATMASFISKWARTRAA